LSVVTAKRFLPFDVVLIFGLLFHGLNGIRVGLVGSGIAVAGDALGLDRHRHADARLRRRSTSSEPPDERHRHPQTDRTAQSYRRGRSARVWQSTAGSGLALVVLATAHIFAQHFVVNQTGGLRTFPHCWTTSPTRHLHHRVRLPVRVTSTPCSARGASRSTSLPGRASSA
jgi:hypothetical protein